MDLWHALSTGGYLNTVVKSKVRSLQQRAQAGLAAQRDWLLSASSQSRLHLALARVHNR